ncbi:hypothetical protein [Winogradskyella poriferorum]|uniref:hypothetical protein n=1 Tax=Winogradskyella poriferorum TaxID=307627 RepID=UPI003D66095B
MRKNFIKFIALFFLSLLLTSNTIGLHVYLHHENSDQTTSNTQDHDNDQEIPCEICLIAINLNSLDYDNSFEYKFVGLSNDDTFNKKDVIGYYDSFYNPILSFSRRNKAPPYLI